MERVVEQECPTVFDKGPQALLWTSLRVARVKITINFIFYVVSCAVSILCTLFINVDREPHMACRKVSVEPQIYIYIFFLARCYETDRVVVVMRHVLPIN